MEAGNLGEKRLGLADPCCLLEATEMWETFVAGFEYAYCYSGEGRQEPDLVHTPHSFVAC